MPRTLWMLIIGMFINVTGSSFLWPLNTIYIHDHLGKSLTAAGFVLMLNSGANVIGNLCGGYLFDKIGGFKSVIIGIVITFASLSALVFFHGWTAYILLLTAVGFGSGVVFPACYAMAGAVWPEGGRKAFNAVYVAQNAGVAVGSALGGVVASFSFAYVFFANAMLYAVFFAIACFGFRHIRTERAVQSSVVDHAAGASGKSRFSALMLVCTGYLLGWVAYSQWSSTIASHTQDLGISLGQYSLLWTVNGALIVLGQPLTGMFVHRFANSLKKQIVSGFIIFMFAYGMLFAAESFRVFLGAMIVLTLGEMLVWPAVPTIANRLAPRGKEGFYQGFVNSMATGGRMIGPLFGGMIVDFFSMQALLAVLLVLLMISIGTTFLYARKEKQLSV
ncbi:multidrug MFS transporter [Bacillus glycinifermentans]|uniref:MFS transporter n=1 Tax=Bacillus glycinifermentans TaxID=1664069 RepID=A0A0J6ECC7_9BACI|nr:MFS transporter [Bacillus glycinifermentans]ATH92846.1 MFS transporter [Bacillus glycinifermentans]KMM53796.1 multidrug MFS transporter [Bacillus glycinifermentans]KRT94638.1 multidrug MFS transporter [Bacillus glycinifermentans]MEC0485690.1 MFS transporter [Bacillus glycinifermentans]MEC0493633.1 MFS transporter [Bacillus glycinifermentans]